MSEEKRDNRTLFTGRAEHYDAARPAYAEALLDRLYAAHGFSAHAAVADVGAGTGIFSEQLARRGSTVYAVEPNADMRAVCRGRLRGYPNAACVAGDAAATGLPDGSVDIVTAAQAFHWFDPAAFAAECARISRTGVTVIVYNMHESDGIYAALNERTARFFPADVPSRRGAVAREAAIVAFFGGDCTVEEAAHPLRQDCAAFLANQLSRSYAPRRGEAGYEAYIACLTRFFKEHAATDGLLDLPNRSVAYIGRVRPNGGDL